MPSLIYSHAYLYRLGMNALYGGKYKLRFRPIVSAIGDDARSVCDLCFGDIIIADWCRARGIRWTGVDLNPHFCARARKRGFEVLEGDLFSVDIPEADVFVMAGSLYHFHLDLARLFDLVWRRTNRFILSEPVRNLSARGGYIGAWARGCANPGDRPAEFRFNERSLLAALRAQQRQRPFDCDVISVGRDMVVVLDRGGEQGRVEQEI